MNPDLHAPLIDDLTRRRGVVMLVGAPDTGKTSLATRLLAAGLAAGKSVAFVDADIDQSTVGPPACAGLRIVDSQAALESLQAADALRFVGSVVADEVDTAGTISGVIGQTLKYHTTELCRPDVIVGLQRGAELEPLIGMLRRFFTIEVETAAVDPEILPGSPEDRRTHRAKAFAAAFAGPLQTWRVRSTVFAPTLPAGLDLSRLEGVLVGVQDGSGRCLGLGALTFEDETLKVITNTGDGMRGLRLGSVRIDLETFDVTRVRLRDLMFGI